MGWCYLLNGLLSPAVIVQYLLRAVVVLITIPFHESAHALASHLLGDDTAVRAGRFSMNPLRHFDPLGALCMLVGGVGWAKPVSINPYNYKNPKVGMALSAAAGPASNLLLAWVSMILYKLCWYSGLGDAVPVLTMFLYYMVAMNLSLAVFNLLPVPPLDGFNIITQIFKLDRYSWYPVVYNNGFIILMVLIIFNITDMILTPAISFFINLFF